METGIFGPFAGDGTSTGHNLPLSAALVGPMLGEIRKTR
jgi:hypothetical protein